MDYMLPTACEMPPMDVTHQHSPSPLNPLGVKGVGEGGAISPPVVSQCGGRRAAAVRVEFNPTPIKPQQIVQAIRSASKRTHCANHRSEVHEGSHVLATRKPYHLLRIAGASLKRAAERRFRRLAQEPPRRTRRLQSPVVQAEPSVGAPS